jgi:virginiamycin B lyase
MHAHRQSFIVVLAGLALCGLHTILPAHAADSVGSDRVVVGGVPLEAVFDGKGGLWVSSRSDGDWGVKHIDFATKRIQTYPQSTAPAEGLVQGPDGHMWFASRNGMIGRIADGTATHFFPTGDWRPWHITAGPDGALWFTLSNYEDTPEPAGAIGRITTDGVITVYPLERSRGVTKIAAGPDGALWATGPHTNEIVRITTRGAISYFPAQVDIGDNAGIAAGPDGNLWYTTGVRRHGQLPSVVRMDRHGKVLKVFSGPGIEEPMAVIVGKDGNIWFSNAVDDSTIGRIRMDGQLDAFSPPPGRLPLQWGLAHDPATGDLWAVEPEAGVLVRHRTLDAASPRPASD